MLWTISAPFFGAEDGGAKMRWIDDFTPSSEHRFLKLPMPAAPSGASWHMRSTRGTPLDGWRDYWRYAGNAVARGQGSITVFPQLAAMAALQRKVKRRRGPHVAWCFNVGQFPGGARRIGARAILGGIDRFVVHSRGEVPLVSEWLGLAEGVVQFVHLQRSPIPIVEREEEAQPFLVAMGSANRDYPTLMEALRRSRLPAILVAAPRITQTLNMPDNVKPLSGLGAAACHALAQRARFSVVPLADSRAASGQVTVIEAMRMRRAVIATTAMGTTDYIEHGRTGLLVPPADPAALAEAMTSLWEDAAKRASLAEAGGAFAESHLSDEAAGVSLIRILDEAVGGRR